MLALSTIGSSGFSAEVAQLSSPRVFDGVNYALTLPGTGPFGIWDPLHVTSRLTNEGQVRFYREVELKHGRIAMLACLGFLSGEAVCPGLGCVPAFTAAPLATPWPELMLAIAIGELATWPIASAGLYPWGVASMFEDGQPRIGGDFRFDPLGVRPRKPAELLKMQGREIAAGRLAMLGITGMVAQELAWGTRILH